MDVLIRRLHWPVIIWCAAVTLAYADDFYKTKEQIVRNSWLKTLNLYLTPPRLLVNFGYNTNVNAYTALKKEDWNVGGNVNVGAAMILKDRFIFQIEEVPGYTYYNSVHQMRVMNNRLKFAFYTHVGRFNFKYQLNLSSQQNRPNTEFGAETLTHEQTQDIILDYGRNNNFFIRFFGKYKHTSFENELYLDQFDLTKLEQTETNLGMGVNKRIFSRTFVYLNYFWYRNRFPHSPEREGDGGKAVVGFNLPEIGTITGGLEFGFKFFQPRIQRFDGFFKPFGSGNINLTFLDRFKFNIDYLIDQYFSFAEGNQYFYSATFGTNLDYYFNRTYKIGALYSWGNLSFRQMETGNVTRTEDFRRFGIVFGIRLLDNLALSLTYIHHTSESTVEYLGQEYSYIGGNIVYEL